MTTYDRFDVVKALFPFVDVSYRKPGPVVVVSPRSFNAVHGHLIGVIITIGTSS